MKNLEYYMGLNYKIEIVEEEIEGGYVLSVPELAIGLMFYRN